jgi:hypothetical protein
VNKSSIRSWAMLSLATSIGLTALAAIPAGLRADESADQDMKIWRDSVEERLKGLHNDIVEFNGIRTEFFTDLRYDYETSPQSNVAGSNGGKGQSGMYGKRAEAKFYGKVQPNVTASVGFDFAAGKVKDLGIQIDELPLIPFVGGPELSVKLGQFRMPFGIETQTSSSAIWFSERSWLNGGADSSFSAPQSFKIIGERAMGIQAKTAVKTGVVDFDAAFGAFDQLSQDQGVGAASISGISGQANDQDLSYVGRAGLDFSPLLGFLPEKSKLILGGSYGRDSLNTAWRAQDNAVKFDEVIGADLVFNLGVANKIQAEWGGRGTFTSSAGVASTANIESWYAQHSIDLLPFFTAPAKGDALEILTRFEQGMKQGFNAGGVGERDRLSVGIKSSYWGGKNHTSVNYYIMANNGQFGGLVNGGPDQMIVVQQQFAFETGKPQWMEKEAE